MRLYLSLELLWSVKRAVHRGQSAVVGVAEFFEINKKKDLELLKRWFRASQNGMSTQTILKELNDPNLKFLLAVVERGFNREPILNHLITLETELIRECQIQMDRNVAKMPYLMMIPVLIFFFPSILILGLGPIIQNFLENMGSLN